MNPRVASAQAIDSTRIAVTFTTGEHRVFDVAPYLGFPVFARLRSAAYLACVRAEHGTLCWPGGEDLCPDTVYEQSAQGPCSSP